MNWKYLIFLPGFILIFYIFSVVGSQINLDGKSSEVHIVKDFHIDEGIFLFRQTTCSITTENGKYFFDGYDAIKCKKLTIGDKIETKIKADGTYKFTKCWGCEVK